MSNNAAKIKNKFYKQERLCSRKQIDLLFEKNKGINAFPVKMVFLDTLTELPFPAQAMFVAPKRSFKKSPDRNKLKRRMREAYRLSKAGFYEALAQRKLLIAFIYTGKKIEDYSVIEAAIIKLLAQALKNRPA